MLSMEKPLLIRMRQFFNFLTKIKLKENILKRKWLAQNKALMQLLQLMLKRSTFYRQMNIHWQIQNRPWNLGRQIEADRILLYPLTLRAYRKREVYSPPIFLSNTRPFWTFHMKVYCIKTNLETFWNETKVVLKFKILVRFNWLDFAGENSIFLLVSKVLNIICTWSLDQ